MKKILIKINENSPKQVLLSGGYSSEDTRYLDEMNQAGGQFSQPGGGGGVYRSNNPQLAADQYDSVNQRSVSQSVSQQRRTNITVNPGSGGSESPNSWTPLLHLHQESIL